jgi:GNAT superfamily N-acetyltransferase
VDDESMEAKDVSIQIVCSNDISRIATAYSQWGYGGGITPADTAWLAEAAGELIGVVRVAPEHGTLVLRGMRIAEQWQRLGIGTRLLAAVGSWLDEGRKCYCVPYTHLVHFYGQIGFVESLPLPLRASSVPGLPGTSTFHSMY